MSAQMLFSTGFQGFFGDFKVYFENEIYIAFSCIKCGWGQFIKRYIFPQERCLCTCFLKLFPLYHCMAFRPTQPKLFFSTFVSNPLSRALFWVVKSLPVATWAVLSWTLLYCDFLECTGLYWAALGSSQPGSRDFSGFPEVLKRRLYSRAPFFDHNNMFWDLSSQQEGQKSFLKLLN